jgi:hypothetical protein
MFCVRLARHMPAVEYRYGFRGIHGYLNQNEDIATAKEEEIQSAFVHDPSYSVKVVRKKLANCAAYFPGANPAGALKRKDIIFPSLTRKSSSMKLPAMLLFRKHSILFFCVNPRTCCTLCKRETGKCGFAPNANADPAMVANSNIKITVTSRWLTQNRSNALIQSWKISGRNLSHPLKRPCYRKIGRVLCIPSGAGWVTSMLVNPLHRRKL